MNNSKFPYKTLIISIAILGAMYIFQDQIKVLLTKSEKMNFLGVEFYFKASQDSKSFEEVQSIYNNIVEQYKRNNSTKDNTIENLKNEFLDLKSKIDECEDVSSIVDVIENEFLDLENINETIQHDSEMISEAIQF